jgi:hypothetical protein
MLLPSPGWRWRKHGLLKCRYPTTTVHDVTTQKTSTWTITAVRNSKLAYKWTVNNGHEVAYCIFPYVLLKHTTLNNINMAPVSVWWPVAEEGFIADVSDIPAVSTFQAMISWQHSLRIQVVPPETGSILAVNRREMLKSCMCKTFQVSYLIYNNLCQSPITFL